MSLKPLFKNNLNPCMEKCYQEAYFDLKENFTIYFDQIFNKFWKSNVKTLFKFENKNFLSENS